MKIAVSISSQGPSSRVDPRFGRAKAFWVYDTVTGQGRTVDNMQSVNAPQGAGIQAAQTVVNAGVEAVITGNCGPKAFRVLSAAGIKLFTAIDVTAAEAVEALVSGQLVQSDSATVESHWV